MPAHPLHAPVLAWYAVHQRDLPWRRADRTPWGVLVSEVMAQQTPIVRALPAGAPCARTRRPSRSSSGTAARSRPTEAELRSLPGVGSYTAAAVAAFAYGRRTCVVDTNVRRVLARTVTGTQYPGIVPDGRVRAVDGGRVASAVVDPGLEPPWKGLSLPRRAHRCVGSRSPSS